MDKKLELVIGTVRQGGFTPGRLSSYLASTSGTCESWRAVIDDAVAAGLIVQSAGYSLEVREPVVSLEDAEARADAIKFADGHVPMALESANLKTPPLPEKPQTSGIRELSQSEMFALDLNATALAEEGRWNQAAPEPQPEPETQPEPEPKPKRRRRTPEEIEADKAAKVQAREEAKLARAAAREAAKLARAEERVRLKQEALTAKIREAEGGEVQLPAVVLRDGTVRHVSDQDAWAVMEMYLDDLMLDCENTGYPPGHQLYELRTVQLGGEQAAIVFDAADPAQMQIASLALQMAKKLRAHSATADVIPAVIAGLIPWDDAWAKMQDSVLNAKLNDPKMSGSDADALKELSADLLREYAVSPNAEIAKNALFKAMGCLVKTTLTTPPEKNGWYRVNKNSVVMTRYAGSDVLDLAAVLRVLPPIPVAESVMDREREFQAACAPVTYVGFKLDHEHIKTKIEEEEAARTRTQHFVEVLTGGVITNPKSPDVIKLLPQLYPDIKLGVNRRTKQPSADKGSLEGAIRAAGGLNSDGMPVSEIGVVAQQILAYRHHDTTLGLLLRPLEQLCVHGDGRMRPTVYTIEASTGRTSCRRPNGQQFSRQGGVRACVCADEGFLGISADFEGCEIRVAAALAGDKSLYDAEVSTFCYYCEEDPCACGKGHLGLHWRTAHGAHKKNATKEHRYQAKRGTFTKLFGGGPDTAAAQVFCEVIEMERIFNAFDEQAPVFVEWDRWMRKCYKQGAMVWRDYATGQNMSQAIDGENRMIYRAYSGRNIYIENGAHAAGNGAIQGTARELLVDGTLEWRKTRWGHYPLLPVHDQILGFVPADEADAATDELVRCMQTSVLSSPGFECRIGADVDKPFVNWPDAA